MSRSLSVSQLGHLGARASRRFGVSQLVHLRALLSRKLNVSQFYCLLSCNLLSRSFAFLLFYHLVDLSSRNFAVS